MLTFKQFLAEGGNIKIGQHEANVVDVTPETRQQVASDIRDSLNDLHNKFHEQHNEHLFGEGARALSTGTSALAPQTSLTGSSRWRVKGSLSLLTTSST